MNLKLSWFSNLFSKGKKEQPKKDEYTVNSLNDFAIPYDTYVQTAGTLEKVPIYSFSWRWMYDLVYSSDILGTVIRSIDDEVFKNGIDITEKFKTKCEKCGREFEEDLEECRFCGGKTRYPEYEEYEKLKVFSQIRNRFGDEFTSMLKMVDNDVNIGDNGFIFVLKDYIYSGKDITGYIAKEVMRFSPSKMRLIYSRYGLGTNEEGMKVYFCPQDRNEFELKPDDDATYYCKQCDRQMLPAYYMSRDKDGVAYYGKDEIYHVKRWSHTEGYGVPPVYGIWSKVMSLLKIDRFILDAYSLQRSPKALLILRGKLESVKRAWLQLMTEARNNPNMIYPLVLEGDSGDKGRVVEYQPFDLKPEEMKMIDSLDYFRMSIGLFYGVQPIFSNGVQSSGLQNEGLQITVTNRTIRESQRVWNVFLEWLSQQLGAKDFIFQCVTNELMDEMRGHEVEEQRLRIANSIAQYGYRIEIHKDARGLIDFDFIKDDTVIPPPVESGGKQKKPLPNTDAEEYEGMPSGGESQYGSEGESSRLDDTRKPHGGNTGNKSPKIPNASGGGRSGGGGAKQKKNTKKTKVYLKEGEQAPPGAQVMQGSNGGRYYIAEGYWHSRDRSGEKEHGRLQRGEADELDLDELDKANYKEHGGVVSYTEEKPFNAVEVDRGNPVNKLPKNKDNEKIRNVNSSETDEDIGVVTGLRVDEEITASPQTKKDGDTVYEVQNKHRKNKVGLAQVDENGELQHHGGANDII